VPWHVLPRKSAGVSATTSVNLGGSGSGVMTLSNAAGAIAGQTDVFALTGTSAQSSTVLPPYGGGQVLVDLKAVGVRPASSGGNLVVQFAVAGFGSRAHPSYPAEFDIYVDANNDGVDDYVIYNTENGGFGVTGQTVITVVNLSSNASITRFFASADLNSSNLIATVLASDIGITSASQKFRFSVYAFDNYFTGDLTDAVTNMVHTLDTPRYAAASSGVVTPIGGSGNIGISSPAGGDLASPSQKGFLLLHSSAKTARESDIVLVTP